MAFFRGPSIVTDGLVLYLDAANPDSYPGSGNTWFDISGNGNHFTLYNGVSFSGSDKGVLVFDGVNDYASSNNNINLNQFSQIVVEVYCRTNSSPTTSGMIFESTSNWNSVTGGLGFAINSNGSVFTLNSNHTNHNTQGARNYLSTDNSQWNQHVNIFSKIADSTGRLTYLNSNLTNFVTGNTITAGDNRSFANDIFYIGSRSGTGVFFNGNISILKIYGLKNSSDQVLQNYNATKTRFGL
jgi:hypothetical protein